MTQYCAIGAVQFGTRYLSARIPRSADGAGQITFPWTTNVLWLTGLYQREPPACTVERVVCCETKKVILLVIGNVRC